MTNPTRSSRRLRIAPGDSRAASPAGRGEAKTADHDYKIENVCSPGNPTRFRSEDRTILVQFSHLSPTHCKTDTLVKRKSGEVRTRVRLVLDMTLLKCQIRLATKLLYDIHDPFREGHAIERGVSDSGLPRRQR